MRSDRSSTGYKGVSHNPTRRKSNPYINARIWEGGELRYLGSFSSTHEAARRLCTSSRTGA